MFSIHVLHKSIAVSFPFKNITGKTLCLEKADLKDIRINPVGRRLEIFKKVKELTCLQSEKKASSKAESDCYLLLLDRCGKRK